MVNALLTGNADEKARALSYVIAALWKPLYKYLRAQYGVPHADACAMTLNFLTLVQQADFFGRFEPRKYTIREFLRQRLEIFVPTTGARKAIVSPPSFDFESAAEEFAADQLEPGRSAKEYYESEWVRTILTLAVEELHNRMSAGGNDKDFSLFMKHDLQDRSGDGRITLEDIANELSLPLSDALISLAKTRQLFQTTLLDMIRSFSSSESEFQAESRAFFRT